MIKRAQGNLFNTGFILVMISRDYISILKVRLGIRRQAWQQELNDENSYLESQAGNSENKLEIVQKF